MQPRKLNVAIARFPYGGNGGISSEHPDVGDWLIRTAREIDADPRIDKFLMLRLSDTPITMTRNQAVLLAKQNGADVLVMIDSDMGPDAHWAGTQWAHPHINPLAKPFFKSSFDYLFEHYDDGPLSICAPYCGPPPSECVYVFNWKSMEADAAGTPDMRIGMYEREHAAIMKGIQPCAAQPTGLIMFDLRLFDHLAMPWFAYEYEGDGAPCETCGCRKPGPQAKKCSTEDVVLTRDVGMHVNHKLGYSPLLCNWDAWAVHHKPKAVGMPTVLSIDNVSRKYADAVLLNHRGQDRLMHFGREVRPGSGEPIFSADSGDCEPVRFAVQNGHVG